MMMMGLERRSWVTFLPLSYCSKVTQHTCIHENNMHGGYDTIHSLIQHNHLTQRTNLKGAEMSIWKEHCFFVAFYVFTAVICQWRKKCWCMGRTPMNDLQNLQCPEDEKFKFWMRWPCTPTLVMLIFLGKKLGSSATYWVLLHCREVKTLIHNKNKAIFHCKTEGYNPNQDALHQLARHQQTIIFHLRTGHCRLNSHLKRIGVKTSAQCPCGEADQTPEHCLQSCSLHQQARQQIWPTCVSLKTKLWGSAEDLFLTSRYTALTGERILSMQPSCRTRKKKKNCTAVSSAAVTKITWRVWGRVERLHLWFEFFMEFDFIVSYVHAILMSYWYSKSVHVKRGCCKYIGICGQKRLCLGCCSWVGKSINFTFLH